MFYLDLRTRISQNVSIESIKYVEKIQLKSSWFCSLHQNFDNADCPKILKSVISIDLSLNSISEIPVTIDFYYSLKVLVECSLLVVKYSLGD